MERPTGEDCCVRCGRSAAVSLGIYLSAGDSHVLGGRGFHCGRCAAEALAEFTGAEFQYLEVAPITMTNAAGRRCVFHFQYLTTGPMPCLQAFELENGVRSGYEAAVVAQPGELNASLVGRLLSKLRRLLARNDVEDAPQLTLGLTMTGWEIRGVLSSDQDRDGPCVIVDGRELDWETFGQLLLSYEGFQFRFEFRDLTDEF